MISEFTHESVCVKSCSCTFQSRLLLKVLLNILIDITSGKAVNVNVWPYEVNQFDNTSFVHLLAWSFDPRQSCAQNYVGYLCCFLRETEKTLLVDMGDIL